MSLHSGDKTYVIDPAKYTKQWIVDLLQRLHQCERVIAHNAKFDCEFIFSNYGVLLKNWYCTQIGSQLITNGKQLLNDYDLVSVLQRDLNIKYEFTTEKEVLQKSFTLGYTTESLYARQLQYVAADTRYLPDIYEAQKRVIEKLQLGKILDLEMDLLPVLAEMELAGVLIDVVGWKKLIKDLWEPKLIELENELDQILRSLVADIPVALHVVKKYTRSRIRISTALPDLFGGSTTVLSGGERSIGYSSSTQVIKLFKEFGQAVPTQEVKEKQKDGSYKTVIKETVDEKSLNTYLTEHPESLLNDFIVRLLDYREVDKLLSTYGDKFLGLLDKQNCIHTRYTQTFTATGRLSSKEPNLQNIPNIDPKKGLGDIRKLFIARPGYKLITCDMTGAEIYIAADYSGEPILLKSILEGLDLHSELATISFTIIFGQPITISKSEDKFNVNGHEYIFKELRDAHKSVVFAKFYKAGAKRVYGVLARYINAHHEASRRLEIATSISKALDRKMPKLSGYLSALITNAQERGFLRSSKLGRIRFFEDTVYGEAANYPIQGSNAEAIKLAIIRAANYLESNNYGRVLMTVHDEILCEVKEEYAILAGIEIENIMASCLSFFLSKVVGKASINIADHWKK